MPVFTWLRSTTNLKTGELARRLLFINTARTKLSLARLMDNFSVTEKLRLPIRLTNNLIFMNCKNKIQPN